MNSQILSWLPLFSLLKILVLVQIPPGSSNPEWFRTCGTNFSCGNITGIQYPFRGNGDPEYCGYPGLVLNCDQTNITTIQIASMEYRVLGINQSAQIMRIAREDVMESVCPQVLANTTMDYNIFDYASNYLNLTFLYGCPVSINLPVANLLSCPGNGYDGVYVLPGSEGPGSCNVSIVVPVLPTGLGGSMNSTALDQVLRSGLEVRWRADNRVCRECTGSSGRCGFNYASNQATCFCPDPPYMSDICPSANVAPPGPSTLPGT